MSVRGEQAEGRGISVGRDEIPVDFGEMKMRKKEQDGL